MAMSKAEMEQHYSAHNRFLLSATSAYEQNRFGDAIKFACKRQLNTVALGRAKNVALEVGN